MTVRVKAWASLCSVDRNPRVECAALGDNALHVYCKERGRESELLPQLNVCESG